MYMKNTIFGFPEISVIAQGISGKQEIETFATEIGFCCVRTASPLVPSWSVCGLVSLPMTPCLQTASKSSDCPEPSKKAGSPKNTSHCLLKRVVYVVIILPVIGENIMAGERKTTCIIH